MGISVLAEAQEEMRARWGKGVNPGPKEKDEPKQKDNRKKSKPATKAKRIVTEGCHVAKSQKMELIVADDEPLIILTVVEILKTGGFDAEAESDGVAAIERARSLRPDILLSDVQMPNMNGIEAAKRIREFLPNCRIVLFSGHVATGDLLEEARAEGHKFEILTKLIDPQDLLSALRHKT